MKDNSTARTYRQKERAAAAEETARRIREAFSGFMRTRWFDEITLEEVAEKAGVTARTVIRRFGGKDGLLEAFVDDFIPSIEMQRAAPVGDVDVAIEELMEVYEVWGDSVIRNLALEPRHPALKRLLDYGRERHRTATAATYSPWLHGLAEASRIKIVDALVAATDIYVWKLSRRDMGRSRAETTELMRLLIKSVLSDAVLRSTTGGGSHD